VRFGASGAICADGAGVQAAAGLPRISFQRTGTSAPEIMLASPAAAPGGSTGTRASVAAR
jgi:hypothetical protein